MQGREHAQDCCCFIARAMSDGVSIWLTGTLKEAVLDADGARPVDAGCPGVSAVESPPAAGWLIFARRSDGITPHAQIETDVRGTDDAVAGMCRLFCRSDFPGCDSIGDASVPGRPGRYR